MIESLQSWAAERGYKVVWGPAKVVDEARHDVVDRAVSGELDRALYAAELESVVAQDGGNEAGSVVVVAVPRPAHRVGFDLGNRVFEALLPPTYFRYRPTFEDVRQDLAANGLPGAAVEHLRAPIKAVSALLGLVRYGRNNITYAPGIGSYLQLCGFITDAPLPATADSPLREPQLLAECDGCSLCASACPTGAIGGDRLLIRAERCLTYANECPGDWPGWVSPRVHHSLLGCLACQRVCPANPKLQVVATGLCFSTGETRSLLEDDGSSAGRSETGIGHKLAWLGQPHLAPVVARNLRALVSKP